MALISLRLIGGAAAWPLAAHAQRSEGMRLIGMLMGVESGPDVRTRIAAFRQGLDPAWPGFLRTITAAAPSFGVEVVPAGVSTAAEIERLLEEFAREPNGGLIVSPSPIATMHSNLLIGLAARHRIPAIYPFRFYAVDGGLVSFGIETTDLFRRAASYVDRILRGEKPAHLPVQAPTKFEMIINLKTAKTLGLEVPLQL